MVNNLGGLVKNAQGYLAQDHMEEFPGPVSCARFFHRRRREESAKGQGIRAPDAAVAKLLSSAGGKLEALYYTFGSDDVITTVDLPDKRMVGPAGFEPATTPL